MKDIKIKTKFGTTIWFDQNKNLFYCDYGGMGYTNADLGRLEGDIEKSTIKPETGEYFVKEYDGIRKVRAVRSWADAYSGKEKIYVEYVEQPVGSGHDMVERKNLYPVNETNEALFQKGKVLNDKGWHLIREGKRLADKLTKV